MRCTFEASNGTLLSAYPWTAPLDIQPDDNQWVPVTADTSFANFPLDNLPVGHYKFDASGTFAARHAVYTGNLCKGTIVGTAEATVCGIATNAVARTHIDVGSPMRRLVVLIKNAEVSTKMDNSINFRVPTGSPAGAPVYNSSGDNPIYHTVQILRDYGYLNGDSTGDAPCSDPTLHLMNIWKNNSDAGSTLIAQCRVKSEIVWAALTSYTAVAAGYATVGHTVIPTVANGFMYNCITGGTSGALQPTWPTRAGLTVTDGTVVWQCAPNVDYQNNFIPLEITDNGSLITASFGGNTCSGTDTEGASNTWVGFWNYHSSGDSQKKMLEVWT